MLTFRNSNIFFIAVILLLAAWDLRFGIPVYMFMIVLFCYSLLLFYGSYYVGSNFFMKVLCGAKTSAKQIAISFDDGPADAYTTEVLQVLKEQEVPAAFFCIGKNIQGRERLLQQMITEGHVIGNHSYSHHFWFDLFSAPKMARDLGAMCEKLEEVTGLKPALFRPPYGVTTPNMKKVMAVGGYTAIGWNIRSMDTVIKDKHRLLDKLLSRLKPGAIVLLHDTSKTTLDALPDFIRSARDKGYEFVRLDKLLNVAAYV